MIKCPYNRQKQYCKECKGICEHNRRRAMCYECGYRPKHCLYNK